MCRLTFLWLSLPLIIPCRGTHFSFISFVIIMSFWCYFSHDKKIQILKKHPTVKRPQLSRKKMQLIWHATAEGFRMADARWAGGAARGGDKMPLGNAREKRQWTPDAKSSRNKTMFHWNNKTVFFGRTVCFAGQTMFRWNNKTALGEQFVLQDKQCFIAVFLFYWNKCH